MQQQNDEYFEGFSYSKNNFDHHIFCWLYIFISKRIPWSKWKYPNMGGRGGPNISFPRSKFLNLLSFYRFEGRGKSKSTSTKNQAGVAKLDAYLADTQNGGHHTHRHTDRQTHRGGYRVAPQLKRLTLSQKKELQNVEHTGSSKWSAIIKKRQNIPTSLERSDLKRKL